MKTLIVRVNEPGDFPETPHYDQVVARRAWDYCNGDMAAAVRSVLGQNLDIAPVIESVELGLDPVEGINPCRVCGMDLGANDPHGADCPVGQLADLQQDYDGLVELAHGVGDTWEHGDLAGAVQGLMAALPERAGGAE